MSWQEELRRLDEELAAGQISADDYRVRRDQVLSSAVSSGTEGQAGQQGQAEATQFVQQAPPPPPPGGPVPQQPGGHGDADKTQIVPGQDPGDADRTQAVGGWQTARPGGGGDAERTQVVPGVPPQSIAGGMPPRPEPGQGLFPPLGPGWQQQPQEDISPPWAGADFPPLAASGSPDWIRQGPELFESGGRSKTGKILLIALIVVIVAGIGVGAYFFFTRDKGNDTAQPPATTAASKKPPPSPPPKPKKDPALADLPGNAEDLSHIKTFADFEKDERKSHLTAGELEAYKQADPGKTSLSQSALPEGVVAYILATECAAAGDATTAMDKLVQLQEEYGLKPYDGSVPAGVKRSDFAKTDKLPATIRAHYTSKKVLVRIQVYGNDLAEISKTFDQILADQLKVLPADA